MQIPKLIAQDEFTKLVDNLGSERDQILILTLMGTGARISVILGSRVEDRDLDEGLLHLRGDRTKTRTYRAVLIPTTLIPRLRSWTEGRGGKQWLFPGRGEGHLSIRRARQIISEAAEKAGGPVGLCARQKQARP